MRKLIIVTAPRNSGKSTRMWELFYHYKEIREYKIGGFITKLFRKGEDKSGFLLTDLVVGDEFPVALENPPIGEEGWFPMGRRYWFAGAAFNRTHDFFKESVKSSKGYTHLFVDEAGLLELDGGGFYASIKMLESDFKGTLVIAVRDVFLEEFLKKFKFKNLWDIEINKPSKHDEK
ncbi:MAG: hypothetical protein JEY99_11020 [Spirochaetales bacterium]|nr:hypothetical protein [Spirochaetales bacterium]